MRVHLRGLNKVRKRLAAGGLATYYYAWKGGPRLSGEFGSPEFIASYHDAVSARKAPLPGSIHLLLRAYQDSTNFTDLRDRTRSDYIKQIKLIESEFGDMELVALSESETRGEFKAWRDKLATRSRRQADYAWTVLARVLSWSKDRGLIGVNPCERGGRLYHGNRAEHVWTDADEAAFLASAPAHLHLPLLLALWTGQRQGDLLRLTWTAYDGQTIRLKQSKTGRRVGIPVGAPLKAALDAAPRLSPVILLNSDGKPWTADGFRVSFGKAQRKAGIAGVTFNDLRGTAVTRLAEAGAEVPEIATITGHSLRDAGLILEAYLKRVPALGRSAITKLEKFRKRTKLPN
jgi:integrase